MRGEYEGYTPGWRLFDIGFGIVAPLLTIVADPIQYRRAFDWSQVWIYGIFGIQAFGFALWLFTRRQAGRFSSWFGAVFVASFACSAAAELCLVHQGTPSVVVVWDWFALFPGFAAAVYLRNARFAFEVAADLSAQRGTV